MDTHTHLQKPRHSMQNAHCASTGFRRHPVFKPANQSVERTSRSAVSFLLEADIFPNQFEFESHKLWGLPPRLPGPVMEPPASSFFFSLEEWEYEPPHWCPPGAFPPPFQKDIRRAWKSRYFAIVSIRGDTFCSFTPTPTTTSYTHTPAGPQHAAVSKLQVEQPGELSLQAACPCVEGGAEIGVRALGVGIVGIVLKERKHRPCKPLKPPLPAA